MFAWQPWVNQTTVQTLIKQVMTQFEDWDVITLSANIFADTDIGQMDIPCR
jgi:hypothetical protein